MGKFTTIRGMYILHNRPNGDFWQGRIEDQLSDTHYLMDVFSPFTGLVSMTTVISIEDISAAKSELFGNRDDFLARYSVRINMGKAREKDLSDSDADAIEGWIKKKIVGGDPRWLEFHINDLGKNGPVRSAQRRDNAVMSLVESKFLTTDDWKTFRVSV